MSLWVFYKGYYSLVDANGEKNHYLYGQIVFVFICLLAVLVNAYSFNGAMMLFKILKSGAGSKIVGLIFCIIEILLALVNLLLAGHNLLVMYKFDWIMSF